MSSSAEFYATEVELPRLYEFVGDQFALDRLEIEAPATPVNTLDELAQALCVIQKLEGRVQRQLRVTYVVDESESLRVAPRRSEHVVCAGGRPVLAAGEIEFELDDCIHLVEVTNYSTGYCPDLSSWNAVEAALASLSLVHAGSYTRVFLFRRCEGCGQRNVVKEGWFFCHVCDKPLSENYNF